MASAFAASTRLAHTSLIFAPFCKGEALLRPYVIELDGSQHLEQAGYDAERTKYLEAQGYTVLRFWNNDVLNNMDGVMSTIVHAVEDVKT